MDLLLPTLTNLREAGAELPDRLRHARYPDWRAEEVVLCVPGGNLARVDVRWTKRLTHPRVDYHPYVGWQIARLLRLLPPPEAARDRQEALRLGHPFDLDWLTDLTPPTPPRVRPDGLKARSLPPLHPPTRHAAPPLAALAVAPLLSALRGVR